jgi:hypothetical protein
VCRIGTDNNSKIFRAEIAPALIVRKQEAGFQALVSAIISTRPMPNQAGPTRFEPRLELMVLRYPKHIYFESGIVHL